MAYLTEANFRQATLDEACASLVLTTDQAGTVQLAATIARMSARIDDLTGDHYESVSATAYNYSPSGYSPRLVLDRRCTLVTSVVTTNYAGLTTTQDSTAYRLRSSLDTGGAVRVGTGRGDLWDYLEVVPASNGLANTWNPWRWDDGPNAVTVTGTWGWTVTPPDIKRAVAMLCYAHYVPQHQDAPRADRYWGRSTGLISEAKTITGIPEVDDIIGNYQRPDYVAVG